MIETIDIKDTIFTKINNGLDNIGSTIVTTNKLLSQKLWIGDTKDKCVQIQTLLEQYYKEIVDLIEQLQQEIITLENNMNSFSATSDHIKIFSSV